jgi:hypothetical protein
VQADGHRQGDGDEQQPINARYRNTLTLAVASRPLRTCSRSSGKPANWSPMRCSTGRSPAGCCTPVRAVVNCPPTASLRELCCWKAPIAASSELFDSTRAAAVRSCCNCPASRPATTLNATSRRACSAPTAAWYAP